MYRKWIFVLWKFLELLDLHGKPGTHVTNHLKKITYWQFNQDMKPHYTHPGLCFLFKPHDFMNNAPPKHLENKERILAVRADFTSKKTTMPSKNHHQWITIVFLYWNHNSVTGGRVEDRFFPHYTLKWIAIIRWMRKQKGENLENKMSGKTS